MSKNRGLSLTPAGMRCCNQACGRGLYVELMAAPDHHACFECDPEQYREGRHPLIADYIPPPPEIARDYGTKATTTARSVTGTACALFTSARAP